MKTISEIERDIQTCQLNPTAKNMEIVLRICLDLLKHIERLHDRANEARKGDGVGF